MLLVLGNIRRLCSSVACCEADPNLMQWFPCASIKTTFDPFLVLIKAISLRNVSMCFKNSSLEPSLTGIYFKDPYFRDRMCVSCFFLISSSGSAKYSFKIFSKVEKSSKFCLILESLVGMKISIRNTSQNKQQNFIVY